MRDKIKSPRKWRIFRIIITLLIIFYLPATARSVGQTITISVSNMPLERVCKEIEKQTDYFFVYTKDMKKGAYMINLDLRSVTIDQALAKLFSGLPLTYQIIDKSIVINTVKNKNEMRISMAEPVRDSSGNIEGVVLSEQGQPLSGATVIVKGTGKSTLTNFKGEFNLRGIPENTTVVVSVSFIGYGTQQVIAKEGSKIKLQLSVAENELDATVVKGYYNTSSRLNTGSVSVVKGEDIAKQPVTDPLLALEGRVPGLYIQQSSGVPGSYSTLQLRGLNSLSNNSTHLSTTNDPLYIIDGVPFSSATLSTSYFTESIFGNPSEQGVIGANRLGMSPFNNLNPADIESIEVLKDADATAIYGARGGNGVILITTKKGRAGQTKIDLNIFNGAGKITRRLNLLNLPEYLEMRHEAFKNDKRLPRPGDYEINGVWDTTRYTDWQRLLIDNPARFTNAQGTISGGNANTQFTFGGGYSTQGTVFPGKYADQKASFSVHINHSYRRLGIDLSASYMNDNSDMPNINYTNLVTLPPDAPPLYDINGNINWEVKNGAATFSNPIAATANRSKSLTNTLISSLSINYQLARGLEFKTHIGYTSSQMNQNSLHPSSSTAPPNNNENSRTNFSAASYGNNWIIEPQLNYAKRLKVGELNFLLGASLQNANAGSFAYIATTFTSDVLIENPAAAANFSFVGYNKNLYHYGAAFGRINYNLSDKYIANFTLRRDGSSRFGPNKQFGNFGALGIAWLFYKEDWIERTFPFLSFGKIRSSYGITGNDQIADYQFLTTYGPSYNGSYQGSSGLQPYTIGNPYFQWERVKKIEIAFELGFFKDRLSLSISGYRNRTDNQLISYPLPDITGFSAVQANLPALIENKGYEFSFHSNNFVSKKFKWTTTFNLSIPKNKLLAYPGLANSSASTVYSVGRSLFSQYLYSYTGVNPQTGLYSFSSKSGSPQPSEEYDKNWSNPVTTTYYGGIQNTFTYNNFQLDLFFQFVKKLGFNYLASFRPPGSQSNQLKEVLNRWQKPGESQIQRFTSASGGDPTTYYQYTHYLQLSDATISDASFIRLRNLAISYQIPLSWQKKVRAQNARFYLQCQNLLTITKYLGLDPESGGLSLPPLRTVTVGFQLTL